PGIAFSIGTNQGKDVGRLDPAVEVVTQGCPLEYNRSRIPINRLDESHNPEIALHLQNRCSGDELWIGSSFRLPEMADLPGITVVLPRLDFVLVVHIPNLDKVGFDAG